MSDAQKWLIFAAVIAFAWLLYKLAPVLTPFMVGAMLAYLGDPLADRLESMRLSRTLAVVMVFGLMLVAGLVFLIVLVPLLQAQLISFMDRLPRILEWIQGVAIPWFSSTLGIELERLEPAALRNAVAAHWKDVGSVVGFILGKVGQSGQVVLAWIVYVLLVPVVTFYLLRDWDDLVARVLSLIPRRYEGTVRRLARECDSVLGSFMRGQLLVMLALGTIYSIGLWIAGVEFALLIGMGAGIVSFVPYLGPIVGVTMAGIVAFMQYHDWLHVFYVAIVFGSGQAIEGMVLSPMLVGERIGLHPVGVIFAVLAGGQLFGFFGVLLALPAAAVVTVLLRFAHERYLGSSLYAP